MFGLSTLAFPADQLLNACLLVTAVVVTGHVTWSFRPITMTTDLSDSGLEAFSRYPPNSPMAPSRNSSNVASDAWLPQVHPVVDLHILYTIRALVATMPQCVTYLRCVPYQLSVRTRGVYSTSLHQLRVTPAGLEMPSKATPDPMLTVTAGVRHLPRKPQSGSLLHSDRLISGQFRFQSPSSCILLW